MTTLHIEASLYNGKNVVDHLLMEESSFRKLWSIVCLKALTSYTRGSTGSDAYGSNVDEAPRDTVDNECS